MLGEDVLAKVRPWELILMDDESASEMLGYRVWLGGEWDLCERYRFLAVVCVRMLNSIRAQKELRKCLVQGETACDMDEDEAIDRRDSPRRAVSRGSDQRQTRRLLGCEFGTQPALEERAPADLHANRQGYR